MPQIHLGVYLTSGQETIDAVRWALEVIFTDTCGLSSNFGAY